ncbi:MAG: alkaline phosphatase family protein [Acidimicrobiales bacterium]
MSRANSPELAAARHRFPELKPLCSRPRIAAILLAGLVFLACAAAAPGVEPKRSPPLPGSVSAPTGRGEFSHVFVVVMENLGYRAALDTPGFDRLARRYGYASDYYAAAHPSLPNYLALTAGSTFAISSDCLQCYVSSDNLGAQLQRAATSWGAFMQSVSQPCYLGTSYGAYAAKHDPFRYYKDIRSSKRLCDHILPLSRLYLELHSPGGAVPRFVWVTPNVCADGHSCSDASAAAWLTGFVDKVTASQSWRRGGVLFVTWDEGSFGDSRAVTPSGAIRRSGGGGRVLTVIAEPGMRAGTVLRQPLSHYGLLAVIEDNFGLPYLHTSAAWSFRAHEVLDALAAASRH